MKTTQPTHRNPPIVSSILIFFLILSTIGSCTKDDFTDPNWQSHLYALSEKELNGFNDQIALIVGEALGIFIDEITKDGMQKYLNRVYSEYCLAYCYYCIFCY